jgi:hypothetical protein
MTKPKFSLSKAIKAVEISSRIEGHKIHKNTLSNVKRIKKTVKN